MTRELSAAIFFHLALVVGCSKNALMDGAMMSAPRPSAPRKELRVEGRTFHLLAGDTHCHVSPPDHRSHVSRDVGAALGLAIDEGLDFVVFTPHVHSRFMLDEARYEQFISAMRELDREMSALPKSDMITVAGFEYTDHSWGHVGFGFGDASVAQGAALHGPGADPRAFFEAYARTGGVMTLNHPLVVPVEGAPIREASHDMSWRAFTRPDVDLPADAAWLTAHSQGLETFNLGISYLHVRARTGGVRGALPDGRPLGYCGIGALVGCKAPREGAAGRADLHERRGDARPGRAGARPSVHGRARRGRREHVRADLLQLPLRRRAAVRGPT